MTLPASGPATASRRSRAKSDRRDQLIAAAERLVAERGFLAVRLEDIGAAAGVSGPAIYRHFPNKEALLVELLVGISTRLLAGATAVVAETPDAQDGAGRADRLPPRLRARRVRPDPHSGPRSGTSARARETSGAQGPAAVRRNLGRHPSPVGPRTQRGGCASDGARRLRTAELDSAQRQTRHSQIGRPR